MDNHFLSPIITFSLPLFDYSMGSQRTNSIKLILSTTFQFTGLKLALAFV